MSRVTVVSPTSRVDLALPADVPIAHLLPTLAKYAGAGSRTTSSRDPWTLARLGQPPFNPERSLGQLQIRDGDILYLRQEEHAAPEAVFDDVVETIAHAQQRSGAWTPTTGRSWSLAIGTTAAATGAIFAPWSGVRPAIAAAASLTAAAVLLLCAITASRLSRPPAAAFALACLAIAYTAAGALTATARQSTPGHFTARDLLLSAAGAMVMAGIAATVLPDAAPAFLAVASAAAVLLIATEVHLTAHTKTAAVAAATAAVTVAVLPSLPVLAFRMARLPMPQVPDSPQDVLADHEAIDPSATLARSERAAALLAAMIGGYALISTGATVALAFSGRPALLLAGVLTALNWTRARSFVLLWQRLPLVVSGAVGVAVVAGGCLVGLTGQGRPAAVFGVLGATAVGAFALAVRGTDSHAAPTWGRAAEVAETALTVGVVPVAAWAAGVFGLMK